MSACSTPKTSSGSLSKPGLTGNRKLRYRRFTSWVVRRDSKPPIDPIGAKNYEIIDTKLLLFLGGRGFSVKGKPISFCVFLVIVIPCGLFFGFPAPWLWHHVSPVVPIVLAYLAVICLSSFFKAAMGDPGILPQAIHLLDDNHIMPQEYGIGVAVPGKLPGLPVYMKYCSTCRIWRPPRTFHCAKCDRCIDLHDHHCVYLNICIGRRNHRYFIAFIVSSAVGCYYMAACCFYHLFKFWEGSSLSFAASARHTPVSFLLAIYGIFASLFPSVLVLFHVLLALRGQTTHEYLRSDRRRRPFASNNMLYNLAECLCRPRGIDLFLLRQEYDPGDRRFEKMPRMVELDE
jgi:palmitoyltransferase ZDHHC9/14/18